MMCFAKLLTQKVLQSFGSIVGNRISPTLLIISLFKTIFIDLSIIGSKNGMHKD